MGDSINLLGCPEENAFLVERVVGKNLFGKRQYTPILLLQEKNERGFKKVVASARNEEIEKVVRRYHEQYLKENEDVAYFTILRGEKIAFGKMGVS